MFSFHSLRRGCLGNHLILAPTYEEGMTAAAMTANWVRNGPVQRGYADRTMQSTRIVTRLNQRVEPALTTVNALHGTNFNDQWANDPMLPPDARSPADHWEAIRALLRRPLR
jgi:hypothetical protein